MIRCAWVLGNVATWNGNERNRENHMDNYNIWLQLILGVIVLIPPIWTILKTYYDKFKIAVIAKEISMSIHEWDDGERYEVRFFLPLDIINVSNSIGLITGIRIKIKYPFCKIFYLYEYISGEFEIYEENKKKRNLNSRGGELADIVKDNFFEVYLNGKESITKNIMFRMFWKKLRVIESFKIDLEIQLNKGKWKRYKGWDAHLFRYDYGLYKLCNGGTIAFPLKRKENILLEKKLAYMSQKICQKYDTNEDIASLPTINLPPSISKW